MYKKDSDKIIKIFFDTNLIRGEFFNERKTLRDFSFNITFSKIVKEIEAMNANSKIQLLIPKIVILEIQQQILDSYIEQKNNFEKSIKSFRRAFGDCLCVKELPSIDDFELSLQKNIDEYVSKNHKKFTVLSTPSCFDQIIFKSIKKLPLFTSARRGEKEFSDAGLKDNLIFETIIGNCDTEKEHVFFFSKDNDFKEICIAKNIKQIGEISELFESIFDIEPIYKINKIVSSLNEDYNLEKIQSYIISNDGAIVKNKKLLFFTDQDTRCEADEENDIIKILLKMRDETKNIFEVLITLFISNMEVQDAELIKEIAYAD